MGRDVSTWLAQQFLTVTGGDQSWLDDRETVDKVSMAFGIIGATALGGAFIIASAPAIVTAAQGFQMWIATASGGGGAALLSRWPGAAGGRATINGITYTVHALERMAPYVYGGRGVPPSAVENAIRFGSRTAGSDPGTLRIAYENVVVITNEAADIVITVMKLGH